MIACLLCFMWSETQILFCSRILIVSEARTNVDGMLLFMPCTAGDLLF